jgi:hypothetical protein
MKHILRLAVSFALFLLLAACEKEEKIAKDDGVALCPLNWQTSALTGGSTGCQNYAAKIEDGAMWLQADIGGYALFIAAQYHPFEANFSAAVEVAPAEVGMNTGFAFQINNPKVPSFDFGAAYRSRHALVIARQADGYHFQHDQAYQMTEPIAPLPDFHHARLGIRREQVEGRDDIVLHTQVFDNQEKIVAEAMSSAPITPGPLLPVFKLYVPFNLKPQNDNDCRPSSWRVLRYDYVGGGKQVSDDFHCNTLFQ